MTYNFDPERWYENEYKVRNILQRTYNRATSRAWGKGFMWGLEGEL